MVADKGVSVRNLQFLSETKRGIIAGVGHWHHDVGLDGKFSRQLASHFQLFCCELKFRQIGIFIEERRQLFCISIKSVKLARRVFPLSVEYFTCRLTPPFTKSLQTK